MKSAEKLSSIRTRVPFQVGRRSDIPAEMLSFTDLNSDKEHVALVFKNADSQQTTPLVRIHSECLTGDVFGSSRCDCGEQLNEAIEKMAEQGGVILYMRQEGRGIGLYNKLDAYELQIKGVDTYSANNQLGFDDDLRDFSEAAQMLKAMGVSELKLLSNNPKKQAALEQNGIAVKELQSTGVYRKVDNHYYLETKANRGKHRLKLTKDMQPS
ncbi:GTP cyclohydrolase II RibA [Agarivorans sp. B2Z047]|uniref:GTP cyclohydrolase II n=1 Tax=Agarivorans sp. B2Z047 TaxID=2652721 RepID=UPI00128C3BF9|nr:GTP cyclohydrolase II [Agarivorans sp. B2Z047]MPW29287.1 GTP cyclohydrolase II RibA [Agarivorans sp. B2Z047]UQN41839.1 GTP cyclohydrolase II [Agarivorans sp. B2Z047]